MTFTSIIGHQQQLERLNNAISSQRVAHAYLFAGPEGVGKKLVALCFAAALQCTDTNGCGQCDACRKVANGLHPDVFSLSSDGNALKIEQIRDLQQQLVLRSFEGRYKICLLDDAHRMTPEAANALLKTLEEPQPGTVLILISSEPERLLPTIRSRCQPVVFGRLPRREMAERLQQLSDLSVPQAQLLAAVARGSFSRALGPHQELYLKNRPILIQTLSALTTTSTIQTFELAETLRTEKDALEEILTIFSMFYRDQMLFKQGTPSQDLINQDLLPLIEQQSATLTLPRLMKKIDAVNEARMHLARNVNPLLAMEQMLMRIVHC